MPSNAIEVEGLGKRYRLGTAVKKADTRLQAVGQAFKAPFRYLMRSFTQASEEENLWALKDVSLEVTAGEVVGIIGRNGAGKTTLLKILSRITDPTEGRARIYGRVGTLLAVGTGFHPELSGRDNIYLNGAIMGMRREEISRRFDEMVDFAEVAKFIDTPVKYYSSGMFVRLAFAVAAHLEPEVLLVDEVLAVGDLAFQKKCLGKMGEVAGEGRTVLLVSHNMEAILGLCPRTVWIDKGGVAVDGPTHEVVAAYSRDTLGRAKSVAIEDKTQLGHGIVRFTGFSLRDDQGRPTNHAVCGQPVDLVVEYQSDDNNLQNLHAWIWLRDHMQQQVTCLDARLTNQIFDKAPASGRLVCRLPRVALVPGIYTVDLAVRAGARRTDKMPQAAVLEVTPGDFFGTGRALEGLGRVLCDFDWRVEA